MAATCSTCGSALHSDLSRLHGKCGPCRWGEDAHAEPAWRRLVREPAPPRDADNGSRGGAPGERTP